MKIRPRATNLPKPAQNRTGPASRGDTVQSLSRALSLLNRLALDEQGLGLSELAQQVGLPVSTTHRLLSTLQYEKFVRFDAERSVWQIGVQAFVVGSAYLRSRDLTMIARPFMRELMEQSGETVNLAIEQDGEVVYIAQIECRETMRAIARTGGRAALHASGLGKALLAAMPDEAAEQAVSKRGLPRISERSITELDTLRTELKTIRANGYALDDEENAAGLRCIAAAIFDEHGQPVAAVSISGPTVRIPRNAAPRLGAMVRKMASNITNELGGRKSRHPD